MPRYYYAVRETSSYTDDPVLHADRGCPAGPVRAAPRSVDGEYCEACTTRSESETSADAAGSSGEVSREALIEDGKCPWCDEYEGEYVASHASSAHPDAWRAYTA